jgi:hypothetical protein
MTPAIPPPPDRCRECGRVGHDSVAHHNPEAAALVWARAVLVIAEHRLDGGARLLCEETAATWSEIAWVLMRCRS